MTNIIVLCHDRYKLTVQTIQSIQRNTDPAAYTLTLVDDDSQDFRVRNFLDDQVLYNPKNTTLVRVLGSRHCLGALKNLGVMHSELTFGRMDNLCIFDNDVFVFPDWLPTLDTRLRGWSVDVLIGGVQHPFHKTNAEVAHVSMTDAVAGYCHFMYWGVWDKYGPYDANAPGIGQSEDFAISRRIVEAGGNVGYINPPVMAHCGITNSNGELIAGADQIERLEGILYA